MVAQFHFITTIRSMVLDWHSSYLHTAIIARSIVCCVVLNLFAEFFVNIEVSIDYKLFAFDTRECRFVMYNSVCRRLSKLILFVFVLLKFEYHFLLLFRGPSIQKNSYAQWSFHLYIFCHSWQDLSSPLSFQLHLVNYLLYQRTISHPEAFLLFRLIEIQFRS